MTISCIIGTYGGDEWLELARERAEPSTEGQLFHEVILSHLPRGSLAQARNSGAEQASGKWLVFLDADDELDPGFGKSMRKTMRGARQKMLFTPSVQYVSERTAQAPKMWPRIDFKNGNWCVIATVINRKFFLGLGGFKEWELYEDWALWATAERAGAEVIEVPEAIYIAHAKRDSRNRAPGIQERLYWHQEIGHDVWPEVYDEPTYPERKTMHLRSRTIRRIA